MNNACQFHVKIHPYDKFDLKKNRNRNISGSDRVNLPGDSVLSHMEWNPNQKLKLNSLDFLRPKRWIGELSMKTSSKPSDMPREQVMNHHHLQRTQTTSSVRTAIGNSTSMQLKGIFPSVKR